MESFGEDSSNLLIVEAMISLAHALGLEVTGEGVKSAEQLELLRGMGCDIVQGYHLARPLPSEEVASLLAHRKASRAPTGARAKGEISVDSASRPARG